MNMLKQYFKTSNSGLGIDASIIDIDKLNIPELPEKIRDEIPTLNKFGYVKAYIDDYTEGFIEAAKKSSDYPVLEIGCGYGYIVKEILKSGSSIVANDIEEKHLEILLKSTPKEQLKKLNLYPGKFPEEINFDEKQFSAILISRVLHFFEGNTLEKSLEKIHSWLIAGGTFHFVAMSTYHDAIKSNFLPTYRRNVAAGVKWPGEIKCQWDFAPTHKEYVPAFLHVFDVPELKKIIEAAGFTIKKIGLFNYPDDTTAGDIGHIGFVARKI